MNTAFSIIYCYRNRDLVRVRRSLESLARQDLTSIEVIFVDYGSDVHYTSELKTLLQLYPFVKFVYNETRGRPWNRAHALNSGIKIASSDFVFTADVDLIFTQIFVETLLKSKAECNATFFSVYLTPKDFTDWDNISRYNHFPKTTNQGLGMSLISKHLLIKAGAYDEFFSFWGYEDNELYNRLSHLGIKGNFCEDTIIAYHQWHISYYEDEKVFPRGWREFMKNSLNIDRLQTRVLDFNAQGNLFSIEERPALLKILNSAHNKSTNKLTGSLNYIRYKIMTAFNELEKNESLIFEFSETTYPSYLRSWATRFVKSANLKLKGMKSIPFQLQSKYEDLHVSRYQVRDALIYIAFENLDRISDYAYVMDEHNETIKFSLVKK